MDSDGDGSRDGNESDAGTDATSSASTPPTLLGWGNNYFGQITQPVTKVGEYGRLPAGIIQVSGGYSHSVAVTSSGAVYAWGDDEYGQATAPTLTGVLEVVAGLYHSLALKSDGTSKAGVLEPQELRQERSLTSARRIPLYLLMKIRQLPLQLADITV